MDQAALGFALLIAFVIIATGGANPLHGVTRRTSFTDQSINLTIFHNSSYSIKYSTWNSANASGKFKKADVEDGGVDPIHEATSSTGQSLNLTISHNSSHPIKFLTWNFENSSGKFKIADIEDGKPQSLDPRLETFENGRVLCIKNLTMEDSGRYYAKFTLRDYTVHNETFDVKINEPLPTPVIMKYGNGTSDRCEVTLRCSVPGNSSGLTYSWSYVQGNSSTYKPYNSTEETIQYSALQSPAMFLCTVSNTIEQKSSRSIELSQCPKDVTGNHHRYFVLAAAVVVAVIIGVIVARCVLHRKKEETKISVQETGFSISLTSLNGKKDLEHSDEHEEHDLHERPEFISIHKPKKT